jgi:ribosomal-protein-alanine N-acetyltransferase
VRTASGLDLETVVRLEAAAFADPWSPAQVAAELTEPQATVLLGGMVEQGPAAGYLAFRHAGGQGEILRVAVAPWARRCGIATALVRAALTQLERLGAEEVTLEVRADNRGAIALYEGLGFRRAGLRRKYYRDGADALVLARLIP